MIKWQYILALVLLSSAFIHFDMNYAEKCFVKKVVDGDTLILVLSSGRKIVMRLNYIDALEKAQGKWGKIAEEEIKKNFKSKIQYQCKLGEKDQYGRYLGFIYLKTNNKEINLSEYLLSKGLVFIYPYAHFESLEEKWKYMNLMQKNRRNQIGLYGEIKVESPWHFRKRMKQPLKYLKRKYSNNN